MASTPATGIISSATSNREIAKLPQLVPRDVSEKKLREQLDHWRQNEDLYRRRGWILLASRDLSVEVGFLASVAFGDQQLSIMTAAIRLTYDNYDVWPPSLEFIDPRSGNPAAPPVQALDRFEEGVRNALLAHPDTGQPFLCVPGVREYHTHPQHSGDDWLLHRRSGAGKFAVVCDIVWRRMARNVIGLNLQLQSLPHVGSQLQVGLAQGDVDVVDLTAAT